MTSDELCKYSTLKSDVKTTTSFLCVECGDKNYNKCEIFIDKELVIYKRK